MALIEKLNFDETNGNLIIQDQTDWAALGITLGPDVVNLYLKVVLVNDTTVTIYDNLYGSTPDIVPTTSLFNVTAIPIPVDSDGNTVWGDYVITVNTNVIPSVGPPYAMPIEEFTFNYGFTEPEQCLTHQVNCVAATVTSRDETDYGQYLTTITRVHNIYPPPNKASVKVGTQPVLIFNGGPDGPMWTGTWVQEVIATTIFTLPSGATVSKVLTLSREFDVSCDTNLCKVRCCLKKLVSRYDRARTSNPKEAANILQYELGPTQTDIIQFFMARDCGNDADMDKYMASIIEKSGCSGDCGCGGDEPQIITALTSGDTSGDVVVDSPDGSITVTPQTVGTTIYYHIVVAAWIQNILNNLSPTVVDSTIGSGITVTSSVSGGITTYHVNPTLPLAVQENHVEVKGRIYKNPVVAPGNPVYLFVPTVIYAIGKDTNASASITFALGENTPNLITDKVLLLVQSFVLPASAPLEYTAHAQVMRKTTNRASAISQVKDTEFEVCWFDAETPLDAVILRAYNPITGATKVFSDLVNDESLYLSISIWIKPS